MQLFLTAKIWKEGKHYVSYNPEFGIASQGKDFEHAQKMLQEAVSLFLETSKDVGTLDRILKESGFVKKLNKWSSPTITVSPFEMTV